jgi:hypothetical protein
MIYVKVPCVMQRIIKAIKEAAQKRLSQYKRKVMCVIYKLYRFHCTQKRAVNNVSKLEIFHVSSLSLTSHKTNRKKDKRDKKLRKENKNLSCHIKCAPYSTWIFREYSKCAP